MLGAIANSSGTVIEHRCNLSGTVVELEALADLLMKATTSGAASMSTFGTGGLAMRVVVDCMGPLKVTQ